MSAKQKTIFACVFLVVGLDLYFLNDIYRPADHLTERNPVVCDNWILPL